MESTQLWLYSGVQDRRITDSIMSLETLADRTSSPERAMLEGLDDMGWDQLTHAYGQADGIPARIRALQSSDPADWVGAISDLYDALCHQMCSIYPATAQAIPFLIELLGNRNVSCRGRIIEFLGNVAFVANHEPDEDDEGFDEDYSQDELDHQTRVAI
jgi:hypothetical protein